MNKIAGSCSCGAINYVVSGDIKGVVNCHCGMCRNMNGSAFSTYVAAPDENFILTSGEDAISKYDVSKNVTKSFCKICGTPIYNMNSKYQGIKILHLGSLDDPYKYRPEVNIFCDTQLAWLDEISAIKSFDQIPE